eukprot:6211027-Pleurochrysis_carterae.AAC.1
MPLESHGRVESREAGEERWHQSGGCLTCLSDGRGGDHAEADKGNKELLEELPSLLGAARLAQRRVCWRDVALGALAHPLALRLVAKAQRDDAEPAHELPAHLRRARQRHRQLVAVVLAAGVAVLVGIASVAAAVVVRLVGLVRVRRPLERVGHHRLGRTRVGRSDIAAAGHVAGHVASVRRVGRAAGRRAVPCGVACRVAPRLLVRYLAQAVIREVGRERRHVDPLVGRGLHRREPLRLLHAQQAVNEHAHLVRQVLRSLDPAQDGEARAAPGLLGRDQLPEPPVAQAGKFEREAAIKQREENHPARPQVGLV